MAIPSFIFGGDTGVASPQELARRREMIQALAPQWGNVDSAEQGIGQLLTGVGMGIGNWRANRAEQSARSGGAERFGGIMDALMPKPFPAAPGSGVPSPDGSVPMPAAPGPVASGDGGGILPASFLAAVDKTEGAGAYDTLYGHAQRNGPFAGTNVSQMTIGEAMAFADPSGPYAQSVKGQIGRVATPMGRHQIVGTTLRSAVKEMGLDPSMPFNAQTQDAIAAHLARKRISSANSMPGKIAALRSEWHGFRNVPDSQMAQIVADLESGGGVPPAVAANEAMAQGTQVASAAPVMPPQPDQRTNMVDGGPAWPMPLADDEFNARSGGLPQQSRLGLDMPDMQVGGPAVTTERGQQVLGDLLFEQPITFGQPMPMQDAGQGPMPPQQAQQPGQLAQVLAQQGGGDRLEMSGGMDVPSSGLDMRALMEAASDPWLPEAGRPIVQMLLEQEMQKRDPSYRMGLEKQQLELDALRNPQPSFSDQLARERLDWDMGNANRTGDINEYEYAKQQGYQGSFADFQREMKQAGASNTNISVGGDGAPGLGKLSTDYGYILDPATNQPVIDTETGLPRSAPIPGSPAAQEIENAKTANEAKDAMVQRYGNVVVEDIDRAVDQIESAPWFTTGLFGQWTAGVGGSPANRVNHLLNTVKSNAGFDRLQAMRDASPTGGALGQVSNIELGLLQAAIGSLEQSNNSEDLVYNLRRVQQIYSDIIHGPGNSPAPPSGGENKPLSEMTDEELEAIINGQ
jgi:hypothetical protein